MKDSTVMYVLFVLFGVCIIPVMLVDGERNAIGCAACAVMFGLVGMIAETIERRLPRNTKN